MGIGDFQVNPTLRIHSSALELFKRRETPTAHTHCAFKRWNKSLALMPDPTQLLNIKERGNTLALSVKMQILILLFRCVSSLLSLFIIHKGENNLSNDGKLVNSPMNTPRLQREFKLIFLFG